MRLFTALDLPPSISQALAAAVNQLRPTAAVNWSPEANWHITTKFLGEFPEARLPELVSALAQLEPTGEIALQVSRLGWFPNPHRPRVLFAGIQSPAPEGLARLRFLHLRTDAICGKLGVPLEEKAFSPHLTLARIKDQTPVDQLRRAIAELPSQDFGSFVATKQYLYASQPGAGGSIYHKLSELPIA